jgi:hypothetical protein
MPTRWNVDHQHALLDPISGLVVAPGESYEFTDEQIEAGLAGSWSEEDPRAGLDAEREFKRRRDAKQPSSPATESTTDTEPATEPEKE